MTRGYDMSLTDKQARFAQEYLLDLNGKQAAIRAGYSEDTAEQQAARLLRNVKVCARVEVLKAERAARVQVTADDVLREVVRCAFYDAGALTGVRSLDDINALPEDVRRCIIGWSWDKQGNFVPRFAD